MGWVEPGYDVYGTQDTFFCRFLRRVLPRATKCGRLGQNGCYLFGSAVAIGGS
jgi:hypothetical protein